MLTFRPLTDQFAVAPQIDPADVPAIAAKGFKAIVNNRPDEEVPEALGGETVAKAARAAGLAYHAIPVGQQGFAEPQVRALRQAVAESAGPVLAYCRSGTRSTYLWALAAAAEGEAFGSLQATARGAGYDLSPLRPVLERMAR